MLYLYAGDFLTAFKMVVMLGQALAMVPPDASSVRFNVDNHADLCGKLDVLLQQMEALELVVSHANAARVRSCLASAEPDPQDGFVCVSGTEYLRLKAFIRTLQAAMPDELAARVALVIAPKNRRYFEDMLDFAGTEVVRAFPSNAVYEIDEAGKCYAVGRHTACVFHLMRAMEVGIYAVTRCLGIPDPVNGGDRNWGAMLRKLRTELDRRNKAVPASWINPADANLFDEVYVSLDGVRNVWRNATMHVENKYTAEEAEHILHNVLGFMRKVAGRCDEHGTPAA